MTGEVALLLQLNPSLNRSALDDVITESGFNLDALNPNYRRQLGVRIDYLGAVNRYFNAH